MQLHVQQRTASRDVVDEVVQSHIKVYGGLCSETQDEWLHSLPGPWRVRPSRATAELWRLEGKCH